MARQVTTYTAPSLADLMTTVNTALAGMLSHSIDGFEFIVGDSARYSGVEYRIVLSVETGATVITNPFQIQAYDGKTAAEAASALQSFIDANPTWFFSHAMAQYVPSDGRRTVRNPMLVVYNTSLTDGEENWDIGAGTPSGTAGGDLAGTYPNPTVDGIQGKAISVPTVSGQWPVYNGTSIEWQADPLVYASLAAAAAAQPQVVGTRVIIYTLQSDENGTYVVNSNTGVPAADYTKISDAVNTAGEVAIVDAGNYYVGTDVEAALQELGPVAIGLAAVSLPVSATTPIDTIPTASYRTCTWEVELYFGANRYRCTVTAEHDGAGTPAHVEFGGVVLGTISVTLDVDVSGGNLRLLGINASGVNIWTAKVIRRALA